MTFASIDAILSHHAKSLQPGETISIPLYKSSHGTVTSVDPLQASRASKQAAAIGAKNVAKSVLERSTVKFPRMMKFIETVDDPDFKGDTKKGGFQDGRLYVEDVPKAKDESDEEADASENADLADGTNGSSSAANNPNASSSNAAKKKRRWRKSRPPLQHWVLQPKLEFLQKFQTKQLRTKDPIAAAALEKQLSEKLSNRYHGKEEANSSCYVILDVGADSGVGDGGDNNGHGNGMNNEDTTSNNNSGASISVMPMYGYTNFTQPAKFHTLSMQQAEQVLHGSDGKSAGAVASRYMMHHAVAAGNGSNGDVGGVGGIGGGGIGGLGGVGLNNIGKLSNTNAGRKRLLGKLSAGDEDNDVMTDLCFRESSSRKRGATAASELLSDVGDGIVKIDAEGILGGANDGEFGGKRRFGRMSVANVQKNADDSGQGKQGKSPGGGRSRGGGDTTNVDAGTGASVAMTEDFYTRDVGAEYNELDFDANELFDDDDVDVGAEEMADDMGGFAADIDEDDEEDSDNDDDDGVGAALGLDGFASAAGLKAMIAKASGEVVNAPGAMVDPNAPNGQNGLPNATGVDGSNKNGGPGVPQKKMGGSGAPSDSAVTSASDRSDDETGRPRKKGKKNNMGASDTAGIEDANATAAVHTTTASGVQLDENGLRIITKEAIRREIWLHNGSIETKKLAKTYKISGKAAPERKKRFLAVCKELCNMSNGMLILKQHYSKMD